MKEGLFYRENRSRVLDAAPKAKNQPPFDVILQTYAPRGKGSLEKAITERENNVPVQRQISFGQTPQTAETLLDEKYASLVTDDIPRNFKDKAELDAWLDNSTDYIGVMKKDINGSGNKWLRFDPSKKYVLGEDHAQVVLSDFTTAVGCKNFQHERFSRIKAIEGQGYEGLANRITQINEDRYKVYNVDAKTAPDIDRYALESPMPKIAYCLECIYNGLSSVDSQVHGNGYSFINRMMTYLDLSFSLVEDLMKWTAGNPVKIGICCLKNTITDIKNGKIDFGKVRATAQKDLTDESSIDKGEIDNLKRYCRSFVSDTLLQANYYADFIKDASSQLLKSKVNHDGDLTTPEVSGKESYKQRLFYFRNEEMINHLRSDVRYVGMGDRHARDLEPRLKERGFEVIHVPTYHWEPVNNF